MTSKEQCARVYKCRDFWHFRYQSLSLLGKGREVSDFIRDVGVAGSNPVTPTIEIIYFFLLTTPVVPTVLEAFVPVLVPDARSQVRNPQIPGLVRLRRSAKFKPVCCREDS
jgi:hypothetical protein